ncbi:MAG: hypothetical protein K2I08_12050 [Muribaculaceae bacterium]|nr:hypothetical protein [Muribaculaceae bacterium]MDE6523650.1 hypothetical protein [Muribaculaceae bacterium]
MMEKDLNKQELDKLIQDWTDELLTPEIDNQIADSLMDFVENDDTEIDVDDLMDIHIHQLAIEEKMSKRRKWKIFVASVAAASVAVIIVASMFLTTLENGSHTNLQPRMAENKAKEMPIEATRKLPMTIADSSSMILSKAAVKCRSEVGSKPTKKREHAEKVNKPKESATELNLIEAIAGINAGLDNMVENTKVSMNMTNVALLPVILFSDNNESDNIEIIPTEYSSSQNSEQMQRLNIIETNLINTLYEIRNLNIDLNFETENIKTEI